MLKKTTDFLFLAFCSVIYDNLLHRTVCIVVCS